MVGEDHDGAVLAEGPQPHEDHPRADAVGRGGHVDAQEPSQRAVAEGGGDLTERRIDGPEGTARDDDEERDRDERLGDDQSPDRLA